MKPDGSDGPCKGRVCNLKRRDWQTGGLSPSWEPSSAPEFLAPLNQTRKCSDILRPKLCPSFEALDTGIHFSKVCSWSECETTLAVPAACRLPGYCGALRFWGLPAALIPVIAFLVCRISHSDTETRDFATEISCDFDQLILAKRVFDTLVQRNTKKQIFFPPLLCFFFPHPFLYYWIFCFLFFLHTGAMIINYVFVMHANSRNFAPADCMHFAFLLCTIQKESGSNYYTGVLYCTGVKECCLVFYELLWICMAGTRTRTVLCPQYV